MKKLNAKQILVPAMALFLICLAVALLLSFTNELTKAPIEKQEKLAKENAMQSVCAEAVSFEEVLENEAYMGFDSKGNIIGYAIEVTVKGYGGDVKIMVGISEDEEITGVEILSRSETPGLGANCTNEKFRSMFEKPIPESGFKVNKDGGDIDAITGATITSRAVTNGVNEAIEIYYSVKGGEN